MPAQTNADAGTSQTGHSQVGGDARSQASAPLRIAFLGPFGTFTEQAVRQVASPDAVLLPMTSAPQALAAVRNGQADRAVVPIENSIEGGVNATLDALAHGQHW